MKRKLLSPEREQARLDAAEKAMGMLVLSQLEPDDGLWTWASSPHVLWLAWMLEGGREQVEALYPLEQAPDARAA